MRAQELRQLEGLLEAARGASPSDLEPFQRFEGRLTQLAATSAPAAGPVTSSAPPASTSPSLWVKSGLALSSISAIALVSLLLNVADSSSADSANDEGAASKLALEALDDDERARARSGERPPGEDPAKPEPRPRAHRPEPLTAATGTPREPRAADGLLPKRDPRLPPSVGRRSAPSRSDQPYAAFDSPPAESPILREIRLLRPVHEALSTGQPQRALATLDALSIHYLGNHATALRAIALCDAGQRAAGRKVALQLGTAATPSIFEAKVSRSCGEPHTRTLNDATATSSTRSSRSETTANGDPRNVNNE